MPSTGLNSKSNNMDVNRHGAQLIFTSHDLSTMNSEVFRRDEIWFVAKGNNQNSNLYSLVEFKTGNGEIVRKDAKYDKQYLEGKYGADPYLRKIIDWSVVNAWEDWNRNLEEKASPGISGDEGISVLHFL